MHKAIVCALAGVSLATFGIAAQAQAERTGGAGPRAEAQIMNKKGEQIGSATFLTIANKGVKVKIHLKEWAAGAGGAHGVHIHSVGKCEPRFSAAGSHFNPKGHNHGYLSIDGPHAGDLPNIWVEAEGDTHYSYVTDLITLQGGERAILDEDGAALILHKKPDNYRSDASGKTGPRVACGVIAAAQAMPATSSKYDAQKGLEAGQPERRAKETQLKAMFLKLDTDDDGRVPIAKAKAMTDLKGSYEAADINNDGLLNKTEFTAFVQQPSDIPGEQRE